LLELGERRVGGRLRLGLRRGLGDLGPDRLDLGRRLGDRLLVLSALLRLRGGLPQGIVRLAVQREPRLSLLVDGPVGLELLQLVDMPLHRLQRGRVRLGGRRLRAMDGPARKKQQCERGRA
jgi:hypothetical protein